jgi:hypothetical protein
MTADSNPRKISLEGVGRRHIDVDFSAGEVSSDGGGLLLMELDRRVGMTDRLADCFVDPRQVARSGCWEIRSGRQESP